MVNTDFFLFLTERMSHQSLLKQLDALSKVTSSFVSHNLFFYTSNKRCLPLYICGKSKEDSCLDNAQIWSTHIKGEMAEVLTNAYMSS